MIRVIIGDYRVNDMSQSYKGERRVKNVSQSIRVSVE